MKKAIIIIVIILAAGIAAWYFWSRRKRPYEDFGRADWAGDTGLKTLAFRLSHKPSVKAGDGGFVMGPSSNCAMFDFFHAVFCALSSS